MQNFVQKGESIDIVAPSGGVVSGQPLLVGSMFGVVANTVAAGVSVPLALEGVFSLPSDGSSFTTGELVYFNSSSQITATASGNTKVGVATQTLASGLSTVTVRLNGAF